MTFCIRVAKFNPFYMTPYHLCASRDDSPLHGQISSDDSRNPFFLSVIRIIAQTTCAALPLSSTERRGVIGKIEQHTDESQPHLGRPF